MTFLPHLLHFYHCCKKITFVVCPPQLQICNTCDISATVAKIQHGVAFLSLLRTNNDCGANITFPIRCRFVPFCSVADSFYLRSQLFRCGRSATFVVCLPHYRRDKMATRGIFAAAWPCNYLAFSGRVHNLTATELWQATAATMGRHSWHHLCHCRLCPLPHLPLREEGGEPRLQFHAIGQVDGPRLRLGPPIKVVLL